MANQADSEKGSETLNTVAENVGRALGTAVAGAETVRTNVSEFASDAKDTVVAGQEKAAAAVAVVKKKVAAVAASGSKTAAKATKAVKKVVAKARKAAKPAARAKSAARKASKPAKKIVKRAKKTVKKAAKKAAKATKKPEEVRQEVGQARPSALGQRGAPAIGGARRWRVPARRAMWYADPVVARPPRPGLPYRRRASPAWPA